MSTDIATIDPTIIQELILKGDISNLNPQQRIQYYTSMCTNLGIDPLTQPFSIIRLQGKETLYANKNCTQQLSKVYKIGLEVLRTERIEDVYVVTVRATDGNRHTDEIGAVTIGSIKGDSLANALMKASTKAKRRAVLAFCGLGMLDETELETVRGAQIVNDAEIFKPKLELNKEEISGDEQLLTEEQGKALMIMLKDKGYDKDDLIAMVNFTWEIPLKELKNKHLISIKEFFEKPNKEITNGKKDA